jgi:hypothetical protein
MSQWWRWIPRTMRRSPSKPKEVRELETELAQKYLEAGRKRRHLERLTGETLELLDPRNRHDAAS